jgi:ornithine cyclodeaminase/alanine dehydrogenase-like protein (mu-crystallin family)
VEKLPVLYLSQAEVASVNLPMADIIKALETAFREKGEGKTEMPPKPGIHPGGGDNFIHAMPAYIPALKSAGVKWVSGFPENYKRSLPYITGLLILNDVETGLPLAVMDCVWITAMRTGAATALSARYLARAESSVVGILGCGVQGRTNLEALKVLFPVKKVLAYDVDAESARRYAREMESRFGVEGVAVETPRKAVSGCDIVVWHPDAMKQASKFCTDDTGQLLHYRQLGYFQDIPPIHADLGELVAGKKTGRQRADERTLAANLGLAIDDMAVAPILYRRALEKGIGTRLPL